MAKQTLWRRGWRIWGRLNLCWCEVFGVGRWRKARAVAWAFRVGRCFGGLEEAEAAVGDGEVAEAEGEGFGSSTAFDELREFELDDVEAGVEEAGG